MKKEVVQQVAATLVPGVASSIFQQHGPHFLHGPREHPAEAGVCFERMGGAQARSLHGSFIFHFKLQLQPRTGGLLRGMRLE
ncbi:hypothetical protein VIGAN_UM004000 [Vigna angularis var. angularis]|uniref:Uncharacterized protein n=1 Tax=Vigna angularis var. angularis TaxID=157739 RepID=A0A0S3TD30_PHAAN|nr:hypothetical protein VIGAN_UM004000 [Vigna angularis var. angularis]